MRPISPNIARGFSICIDTQACSTAYQHSTCCCNFSMSELDIYEEGTGLDLLGK